MASVLTEALNSQNPTGRLHSEAVGYMLSVARKLKTESLAYTPPLRQDLVLELKSRSCFITKEILCVDGCSMV